MIRVWITDTLSQIDAKICLLCFCSEALPLLRCIKGRPQNAILCDELLSALTLLSLALTILHVAGWNLGWLGVYCSCSVREIGEDTVSQSGLEFRFSFCDDLLSLSWFGINCLFSPLIHTGAFTLTHWLIVCIRYNKSISVSARGRIDIRIIDPGIIGSGTRRASVLVKAEDFRRLCDPLQTH